MTTPLLLKRSRYFPVLLGFVIAFLIGVLQLFFPGQSDFFFLDLQYAIMHSLVGSKARADDIVIVLIDEVSYQELKLKQEASFRPYHAKLLEVLMRAKVRVIAFDLVFVTPEANTDEMLARVIKQCDNVVAGEIDEGQTIPGLRESFKALGSLISEDYWGIPRKINANPYATRQKAFFLEIIDLYRKKEPGNQALVTTTLQAGSGDSFWLNYKYRPEYFPVISYASLLNAGRERLADTNHTPLCFLYDKIVLIGYYQEQSQLPVLTANKWPGVYAHAYALENLLHHSDLKKTNPGIGIILILLTLTLMLLLNRQKQKIVALGGPWLGLFIIFCIQYYLLSNFHLWLNISSLFFSSLTFLIFNSIIVRIRNVRDLHELQLKLEEFEKFGKSIEQRLAPETPATIAPALREVLVDNVFHDIKNYVVNIETCIKMISERYQSQSDKNFSRKIDIIKIACRNIEYLSKNILEVKQLEEGRAKLNESVCTYEQILTLARELIRDPICEIKNLKVKLDQYDSIFKFQADSNFLERVLHNLFNNAFKYSLHSGEVHLTCEARADEIIVSLFNTSIPLTEEQKIKVFEKYYQVPKASASFPASAHAHSQGLGLYFCRLVLAAQNGRIWVESDQAGNYFKLGFKARSGS